MRWLDEQIGWTRCEHPRPGAQLGLDLQNRCGPAAEKSTSRVPPNSRNAAKKELSQRAEHPIEYPSEPNNGVDGERRGCPTMRGVDSKQHSIRPVTETRRNEFGTADSRVLFGLRTDREGRIGSRPEVA